MAQERKKEEKKKKKRKKAYEDFVFCCDACSHYVISQLAFFINLQRAVIGPSATLTGWERPAADL